MELLSPAGSFDALQAAVSAGADSIYLGSKSFSARRSAQNFDDEALAGAISYCHKRGVKVYAAVNTLITDREMERVVTLLEFLYKQGADGIIVQDLGLAWLTRKYMPDLPLHASTQMTINTLEGAKMAAGMGFSRVVLARELAAPRIKEICRKSGIEVEVFAHGALCTCYSGQCLMSSMIGGRSGNRGACAQPCRLPYTIGDKNGTLLSLKDLSLISHIDELKRIGVHCLKIEGRMKGPEYIDQVIGTYRKALDGNEITIKDIKRLENVFYRGGYTDGYYTGRLNEEMYAVNKPENPYLRRESYKKQFEKPATFNDYKRDCKKISLEKFNSNNNDFMELGAYVNTKEQLEIVRGYGFMYIYAPPELHGAGVVCTPPPFGVIKPSESLCASNIGQLYGRKGMVHTEGGFQLNIFNSYSIAAAKEIGLSEITLSPELMLAQIRDIHKSIPCNAIIYGRLPLMYLANPPKGKSLKDRKGTVFPIVGNVIYNSCPIYMGDKLKDVRESGINKGILMFTTEKGEEVRRVIGGYLNEQPYNGIFTRGKFYKGV